MKKLIVAIIFVLMISTSTVFAEDTVDVELPEFPVEFNGIDMNPLYSQYPLFIYKGVTYLPITYNLTRSFGLNCSYSNSDGLKITETKNTGGIKDYLISERNPNQLKAFKASFVIEVNGIIVDNHKEEYPILTYNNITYFPLTWRWVNDEFGWDLTFSKESGLNIVSKEDVVVMFTPVELSQNKIILDINASGISNSELKVKLSTIGEEARYVSVSDEESEISISNLKKDTEYSIEVMDSTNKVLEYIPFKTLSNNHNDYRYFIDTRDDSNNVIITMFALGNGKNIVIEPKTYHTAGDEISITSNSYKAVGSSKIHTSTNNSVTLETQLNKSYGFKYIVYKDFKSSNANNNGDKQFGYKTTDYLLETGESLLIYPTDINSLTISMVLESDWSSEIGLKKTSLKHMYLAEGDDVEWLHSMNIQAYSEEKFDTMITDSYGYKMKLIYANSIEESEASKVIKTFEKVGELWGDRPVDSDGYNYNLLVVDEPFRIYGGEYSTGQSYSTQYDIYGEMAIHQMYHVWNGWKFGMGFGDYSENWRFWSEGFNRYFSWKILEDIDAIEHYYTFYKTKWKEGKMISILSDTDEHLSGSYSYDYGALLAYALDEYIKEHSSNKHELADVLKYVLIENRDKGIEPTYQMIKGYINTLIDGTIDTWWYKYVENAEELVIYDFEK